MVSTKSLNKTAILTGLTASGKTQIAIDFAHEHSNIEIINADSILIYKGLDIGSAKPTLKERKNIPHHLIDIKNPDDLFTAGEFQTKVHQLLDQIHSQNKRALIVGGTGFYIKSLLYPMWEVKTIPLDEKKSFQSQFDDVEPSLIYKELQSKDPVYALSIKPNDRYRILRGLEILHFFNKKPSTLKPKTHPKPNPLFSLLVIDRDKSELLSRIKLRTNLMIEQGFIEEVKNLASHYKDSKPLKSVGYKQILDYLNQTPPKGRKPDFTLEGLKEEIILATKHLCKKQRTWFQSEKSSNWFLLDNEKNKLLSTLKEIYLK